MSPLKHPDLYVEHGTEALPGAPALRAVRSRSGHISFPPQHFGCQLTGDAGDELTDILVTGRGKLHAMAVVHMHRAAVPPAPFTVVEVVMDDGFMVRGLLASAQQQVPARGAVLITCLEESETDDGRPARDLRFIEPAHAVTEGVS